MILECLLHNIKELPPLTPENMTKEQLLEFIPKMMSLAEGRSHVKPEWWPEDASLTLEQLSDEEKSNETENGSVGTLRKIVTKCYQYFGRGDLLKAEDKPELRVIDVSCQVKTSKMNRMEDTVLHTSAVDEMMDLEVEEIQESGVSDLSDDDIIIYSEESETENVPEKETKSTMPTYLIGNSQNFKSHFDVKLNQPKPKLLGPKCARRRSNIQKTMTQFEFLNAIGLKSTSQLKLEQLVIKKEVDIDCEILSVEEFDKHQICSPRSSRTLISQMSRDMEHSPKKRLSFCATEYHHYNQDETEDSCTPIQGCLLRIPFSSLLGTRLKKHVKGENTLNIIYNPSEYCGTAPRPEFTDKLRIRQQDFPITYKRRRKGNPKHSHEIKFSKADKKKFLIRVKTGLTERSRRLKRLMKNCKVILKRVTDDEIKHWAKPMFHDNTVWTIDDDISIVAVDIPMSNVKTLSTQQNSCYMPSPRSRNPLLSNILRENRMECLTSEPRPCFLVKKVEKQFNGNNGDSSSKMVYIPVSQHLSLAASNAENPFARSTNQNSAISQKKILGGNRRKQNFQVRQDLDDDCIVSSKPRVDLGDRNNISLLKSKLKSDSFQPYQSILPKSYEQLQRVLKNVLVKPLNSVCDVSPTNTVQMLSHASPTCQINTQTVPPCIKPLENKIYAETVSVNEDELQNFPLQELKISSVYSLHTDSSHAIRKELGKIGCFSSIDDQSLSEQIDTSHHTQPATSNSHVKPNGLSSVFSKKDESPIEDDDDDCICVGEIITIDDDD